MNILVVDSFPKAFLKSLRSMGHPVTDLSDSPDNKVIAALSDAEILVLNSRIALNANMLGLAPNLKLVCRAGVGMDHFDLGLMEELGIEVVNAPGANALPVGEQALGMLLSLLHNIRRASNEVSQWKWKREENRGTELSSLTVGIIGLGNTGSAFASCLRGFECEILAYDKYKTGFGSDQIRESNMQEIFERVDVLSLHVPLADETAHLVDFEFLQKFKKPIFLLNLSRGGVVNQVDLGKALKAGLLRGLALDVLENEKIHQLQPDQKKGLKQLLDDPRVIVTPHIGGWSHGSLQRINDKMLDAISSFLAKKS